MTFLTLDPWLPFAEVDADGLIRLLVFLAIFIGPAILKSIQDSKRKRKELEARRNLGPPKLEAAEVETEEPDELELEVEEEPQTAASGREQWERLLRGEAPQAPPAPPAMPPPLPVPARRRVLTESPPLTDAPALTDAPLTSARPQEVAQPHASYESTPSYDEAGAQQSRLGKEFEQFATQEGLASDRAGGPVRQVGSAPTFAGGAAFADLQPAAGPGALERHEIGGTAAAASRSKRDRLRLARVDWRRSILAAEILGPPLALRALESGPTRPLGWS